MSVRRDSFYDVYASGITLNGLRLPGSIAGKYRDGYYATAGCAFINVAAPGYSATVTAETSRRWSLSSCWYRYQRWVVDSNTSCRNG